MKKYKEGYGEDDDIVLRDSRSRVVNFEMTGFKSFSVTTNFFIPTEIVNILKKFGAFYDKKHKEWTVHINKYKEVALEVKNFC